MISLSPSDHLVHTSLNRSFHYDKLVLATGSTAGLPPYVSPADAARTKGVFVYRNISDLEAIIQYAERGGGGKVGRAVVVGGGLLGLEAAKAVYDLKSIEEVTIINRQAFPLSRQLDQDAGEMVLRKIEGMGVQVLTNISPTEQLSRPIDSSQDSSQDRVFTGFTLSDETTLAADLVIYAIGIKPRDELALSAEIECHRRGGVVVKDDLGTSAKDVY